VAIQVISGEVETSVYGANFSATDRFDTTPMNFEIFSAIKSPFIRWLRHLLAVGGLCLLVACGGGGGGGSTSSTGAAPAVALARSGSTDPIYSGNAALLLPTFNYGLAVVSWLDAQGATQLQAVTSNSPIQVNPTQTTTYTLTVSYQDPSTVRPQTLTATTTQVVTIKAAESLVPTYDLVASSSLITRGQSVTLTPTFSWSAGTIVSSVIKYGATPTVITATTATAVTQSPTSSTTYTLRIEYRDERVIPAVVAVVEKSVLVDVTTSPGNLSIGGTMSAGRSDHVMVQLPGSTLILVAGGTTDGTTALKTAELYDTVNNTWRTTGEMKTARRGHTATVLQNGKILVVGGNDGVNTLATAETYDPTAGVWTNAIGPLAFSHRYHTATLLSNGKVLIAGGTVGLLGTADAKYTEVYSPAVGTFSAGPLLSEERQGHSATLLSNGDVLFVGNSIVGGGALVRTLTYDGTTFTWAHLASTPLTTGSLIQGRYNHSAVLLSTGKVLVTGGFGLYPNSAELYDPTARTWSSAGNMTAARSYHTSTALRNGDVLVIGGYDGTTSLSSLDYYDAASNTWSSSAQKTLSMGRAMNTSLMLSNGKVLTLGSYCPVPSGTCTTYNTSEIWAP